MNEIQYASAEEQIAKLKSQNLIIANPVAAKQRLERYGYSNLIKSYRDPYVITTDKGKVFRSDITFEQICSLYTFDKNLRISVMAAMIDLEEHVKEVTADVIAQSFGVSQNDYLQYRNYQNKRKHKRRFSLTGILETLNSTLETDKEPIHHYMEKYGIVPPWILFKSVYFSTTVNFIDQLKKPQQTMLIKKLYSFEDSLSEDEQIRLMMDTLFICLEYRNLAAHGGRIYNYKCRRELNFSNNSNLEGFSLLLQLLHLLNYQMPYKYLYQTLNKQLNKHCNEFPQDVTYLSQILNVNISSHQVVWVTEKSNKYHIHRYCSGLKNAQEIALEKAQKLGFTPCKRCCQ